MDNTTGLPSQGDEQRPSMPEQKPDNISPLGYKWSKAATWPALHRWHHIEAEAYETFLRTTNTFPNDEYRDAVIIAIRAHHWGFEDAGSLVPVDEMTPEERQRWKDASELWGRINVEAARRTWADYESKSRDFPDDSKDDQTIFDYLMAKLYEARTVLLLESLPSASPKPETTSHPSPESDRTLATHREPMQALATDDAVSPIWKEQGKPVKPATLATLVESKAIDINSSEGAVAILAWAKEYQKINGRYALNVTRDIDQWVGIPYKTLHARAQNKRKKRGTNSE